MDRGGDDPVGLPLRGPQFARARRIPGKSAAGLKPIGGEIVKPPQKIVHAAPPHRRGRRHRNLKLLGHPGNVDFDAAALGDIDHIQDEEKRLAKALKLNDEPHREP